MISWMAFFIFTFVAAADTLFAAKLLQGKPWKFLLAGNPMTPEGHHLYHLEKWQRSAGFFCASYAAVFALSALMTVLTQINSVLSQRFMAITMYIHGAVLVLGVVVFFAYADSCCQHGSAFTEALSEEK